MPKEFVVTSPRTIAFRDYEEPPLAPDQVRIQSILSGISHGTELNLYRGTAPFYNKRFDPQYRLFLPAEPGVLYPSRLGYEMVGRVIEVGSEVRDIRVGDLVHVKAPHRETNVAKASDVLPLPEGMKPQQGIFLALSTVALYAIHDAKIKLGDLVGVFGLGTIGLLAVQMARLNGASQVFGVDRIAKRRAMGRELEADMVLDPADGDVALRIKKATPRRGVDVAIDASGHYPALQEAIRSVQMGGTVVALGYYQGMGSALRLGEEWHHNRPQLISSMGVWGCPHRNYPLWDYDRAMRTSLGLIASGKVRTEPLLTHVFPFERAPEAYRLIDEHPEETIKVAFSYSDGAL